MSVSTAVVDISEVPWVTFVIPVPHEAGLISGHFFYQIKVVKTQP